MGIYLDHRSFVGKPLNPHRSSGWAQALGLIAFVLMAWTLVYALLP